MQSDHSRIHDLLVHYSTQIGDIRKVYFSGHLPTPPLLAYQVHFPRLELIISGEIAMELGAADGQKTVQIFNPGDVIYLPADSWNRPIWDKPAETLSILVGKKSFGLSLLSWNGEKFGTILKENIQRLGPRTGSFIVKAIEELMSNEADALTLKLLIPPLLSHIKDLAAHPSDTLSKSEALFEAIRNYIEQNYYLPLTRDALAEHFYISPNYLSQLFQKEGSLGFNEYLTYIRLERAKYLLKDYDMKIKEVAQRSGFSDSNYFCRIFKAKTQRSPSEYRVHYRNPHKSTTT